MNLDELRSVQAKERTKDSLQHLRDGFYDEVAAYIADLRAARDQRADLVAKPFSDGEVGRLSDEIETAEEVAEAVYERRVGKVVKLASFAAANMPVDADGMTTQERRLFDDLVARIGENKATVLDAIAGEGVDIAVEGNSLDVEGHSVADEGQSLEPDGDAASTSGETGPGTDPTDGADGVEPDVGSETTSPPRGDPSTGSDGSRTGSAVSGGETDGFTEEPGDPAAGVDGPLAEAMGRSPDSTDDPEAVSTPSEPTPVEPGPAPPDARSGSISGSDEARGADAEPLDVGTTGSVQTNTTDMDRTTVRITADVGSILGVDDREYDLANEDVVSLPAANAEPLVRRDAAERIR